MRERAFVLLFLLALTLILVLVFRDRLQQASLEQLIFLLLAGLVVGGAWAGRGAAPLRLRYALAWLAILGGLALGYTLFIG